MKSHKAIRDMIVLAMFGALLFAGKIVFEALPNIHPVAMLIMVITVTYRVKALVPIYLFVIISGLYYGFPQWWIPYMYIWPVLWGMTMIIPRNIPEKVAVVVYPVVCGLYGFVYGVLYDLTLPLIYGNDLSVAVKSIIAGLYFDAIHAFGNLGMGTLVYPLSKVVKKLK